MRRRSIQILFCVNQEEYEKLQSLVRRSRRPREAVLRSMLKGYQLCEKPEPEFYQMMRELSAIGNRINQLAAKANALNYIDTPMLKEEAGKWHELQLKLRRQYLMPKKLSDGHV